MKELERAMMATAFFLEDVALKYLAKTGRGVRGFIVTKAMRDELANDSECEILSETSVLIGVDGYELYTSNYNALMIIDMAGNVEAVK